MSRFNTPYYQDHYRLFENGNFFRWINNQLKSFTFNDFKIFIDIIDDV